MRLLWRLSALAVTASSVAAFAPVHNSGVVRTSALNQVAAEADVKASAISADVSFNAAGLMCGERFTTAVTR